MKIAMAKNSGYRMVQCLLCAAFILLATPANAQQSGRDVQEYIERTNELLIWAEGIVSEAGSEPARRILGQATQLHERSRGLLRQDRRMEAMGVARRARDAVWHAVRSAREAAGLEERIRHRAERFRDQHGQLGERAREAGHGQAQDFLDQARRQADRAGDLVRQGDLELAWKVLEQAEDLLARAARLLGDSVGPERLDREIERVSRVIENARQILGEDAKRARRRHLAEAESTLQRALAARERGRPGQAMRLAGLAEGLARRAMEGGGGRPGRAAVDRQLERFDVRAARIAERVRDSGSEEARRLFAKALAQRDRAAESAGVGDREQTLRRIRAATDLLDRTENLLR